jgi:hypothetical protein
MIATKDKIHTLLGNILIIFLALLTDGAFLLAFLAFSQLG